LNWHELKAPQPTTAGGGCWKGVHEIGATDEFGIVKQDEGFIVLVGRVCGDLLAIKECESSGS